MMSIDELEAADVTLARHCAESVWKKHGKAAVPVLLLPLLKSLSLANLGTVELPKTIRGACVELEQGEGGVLYNPTASFLSKRWTVVHEIGHWCLGHVSTFGAPTSNLPHNQEKEANAFAGALLIPPSDLKKYVKLHRPRIADIRTRYLVTDSIAGIAVSKAGILKYISSDK